jgi:SAM-dependent methyltransferase
MSDGYSDDFAASYDAQYGIHRDPSGDGDFYLQLARRAEGAVLELGCGTGRVLSPIAAEGIECVGIDTSAAMLDQARAKGVPPNLRYEQADARSFDLGGRRFGLIFSAFRAFQHLYTVADQLACLSRVRAHLAPGGRWAFDVFNPDLALLAEGEIAERQDIEWRSDGRLMRRFVALEYRTEDQIAVARMRVETWSDMAKLSETSTEICLRWFHRYELEHLLERSGFSVVGQFGDFKETPIGQGPDLIFVAEARPGRT